ncbi:MAG: Ig-like domain-containing protein [Deltaproteobacteria bacterium]|nr:Ig-like domain-containing protein [Deltaproteobacteria bacterium]
MFARSIAWTTLLALVATSCGGKKTTTPDGTGAGSAALAKLVLVKLEDAPDGIDLRVSNGAEGPPAFDRAKLAPAKTLSAQEANALLARAKPIAKDATDAQDFALRPGSQPPPRTGQTLTGQFPPAPSSLLPPVANDAGKDLRVLRYMPEGAVPLAPELSVTFSQAMVAVTSQTDAAATTPVKLTPQPKGNWRWIGTRTVLFDPEVRFPQATTYQVEIPAGTKSANGGALAEATKFTFETPPATVVASYPSNHTPQHINVPMFVSFDQKIDPAAVLAKIKVTANGKPLAIRMLDAAELEKAKPLADLVAATKKDERDGRWLAFRATQDFPSDATISVEIAAGTPSAEGPNLTKTAQHFSFQTYPPLRVVRAECGYQDRCPPGQAFSIQFNNPLDDDKFDESQLTVSPEIPGMRVIQNHSYISLQGATKARTTYKVTISSKIRDEFGQTLGKDDLRTWHVTDAHPTFFGPNGMVVLDPVAAKRTLDFFSTNYAGLKVRLYKVAPGDYDAFGFYVQNQWNKDKPPKLPGTKVFDQLVKTSVGANDLVETSIDLAPALDKAGLGHAIAIVEPHPWTDQYEPPRMISWVQSTKLAVDAYVDADSLIAFATELETGKPATGVSVELRPFGITGKTDDKGLATLPLAPGGANGAHHLIAKRGDDVAFVVEHGYWNNYGGWVKQVRPTNLAWYVIDDRKMYKPGEEVTLKGWLRSINTGKHGDVGPMPGIGTVAYKVYDSQGNQIATGSTEVSAVGGFDTKFTLPKTPNLGHARVDLTASGKDPWNSGSGTYSHGFQIEEFRRPEFEVTAQASQGPFLVAQGGDVTVKAKYYTGGPLPGAPVQWNVSASQTSFTPPNRDGYVFGNWTPWWGMGGHGRGRHHGSYDDDGYRGRGGNYKPPKTWSLASTTDATGSHTMHLDFLSIKPAVPMSVQTTASVTDVNRQTWTASSALIVHPSAAYVGLKTKKAFVEKGRPFELEVIGVDLDGKVIPNAKIELAAVRLDWEYKKGQYTQKEVDPQTCTPIASKDGPAPCTFATKHGGTYKVTATIVDAQGRPNQTSLTFWVTGGDQPAARDVQQEVVQLIPDKQEYVAGNTAELLLQAPFYPAEGVVSWRRSGIVKTERISITGPTKVITVPITDAMVPNLHVQVDLVGAAARLDDKGEADPKLPKRPAYAVGSINLPIPPKQRTLAVTIAPNTPKVGPGESAKLALTVVDSAGRPVANADAAVLVVDEAILALTGYQFPDPLAVFYGERGADARDHYLRAHVKLAKPDAGNLVQTAERSRNGGNAGPMGGVAMADMTTAAPAAEAAPAPPSRSHDMASPKKSAEKSKREEGKDANQSAQPAQGGAIAIRSNFNPLAAFSPTVKTDAQGRATVDIKVPDNLTRYRIVAIATAGDKQFGKGESAITARLPLMVRPSPPRFLNFGDTFRLPVVVQNQTDAPMTVRLAARTTNALLTDGVSGGAADPSIAGREVTVPANDRVEVQFPAAAEMAGIARFQIVGTAGGASDAAELALPVWTPATTEAFATYGVIDDGAIKQPVALPGAVVTQFGGIEVTTASTNLQALTDALLYLVKYPYECAEQRASRIMAIAALKDVLTAFKTKDMPSPAALDASIKGDIERLSQLQNHDGGFAFWERGRPSEPYVSVYVTNALARAKQKGFAVPQQILDRGQGYLRTIENHYPHWYSKDIRQTISSYALYTRKQLADLDVPKAQKLYADAGGATKLSMEANAWLLGTMAGQAAAGAERKAIVRHALNKVSETAGAANFTTSYGDGAYVLLASDHRVDAVMLESLIQEQRDLDLIPKIVTGLLAHRKAGRWLNTQENTFALVAMDRYFQTYEKTTPDFVARVWLGNDYAGDHAFKGRSTDYFAIPIPMKDVASHDKQDLTIQKDGKGRLYYRIGMTYAPASLKLDAADYGFVVQRTYEGLDDPADVVRQADGTWKIKAGSRVRIKLTMVNENRRYHVALVDPLPAGLETLNPALAVTGPVPTDPNDQQTRGKYWWWYGPWYEHQNLRDERTEAFTQLLWEGVHKYTYVARATTPGNFVVPPPKAEEMYMPETFGRGASDRVIVE